jgi:hypothetical protein
MKMTTSKVDQYNEYLDNYFIKKDANLNYFNVTNSTSFQSLFKRCMCFYSRVTNIKIKYLNPKLTVREILFLNRKNSVLRSNRSLRY